MFELVMYVYCYCNALSARSFAVDRALNSYFMIYYDLYRTYNHQTEQTAVVSVPF